MGNFTINGNVNVVQIQQDCDNSQIIYNSDDFIQNAQAALEFIRNNLQNDVFSDVDAAIANADALENEIKNENKQGILHWLKSLNNLILPTASNVLGNMVSQLILRGGSMI